MAAFLLLLYFEAHCLGNMYGGMNGFINHAVQFRYSYSNVVTVPVAQ
ncbi:hypothetical protein KKI93_15430 [Xenorhabdus bovienii]|nr:hypothetical protein [Xenorhabdus bovienii]MDE9565415.1 hypothetical protein [Xenorhabdus bovienii]